VRLGWTGPGRVDSGGTSIYYIIDLPEGEGPFLAIVYGPGSGNAPANLRHHVSRAERLIELGYAVVRYDKRGTGRSEGEVPNLSTANSATVVPQLAADMRAVLLAAQGHEEVDSERLALFGLSQAAWYLPIVATEFPEVQFMIMVTGGLTPVGYQNYWESLVFFEDRDPFALETLEALYAYEGPTGFDQRPLIRDFGRPMLYLIGEADPTVAVQPLRDEYEIMKASGVDITLETYTGGVHVLDGIDFWDDVAAWLDGLDLEP
jgi:pimeloyl-ACP methyl ester carboxylesterase